MILLRINKRIDDSSVIYLGSHNFSSSAWGRLNKNDIGVANFEVGILWGP